MSREAAVAEKVREIASRVAGAFGLDIFDVQYRHEAGGMVLRVQLDRPGPAATAEECVSVEDCAKVSRDLSAVLDVEDVIPAAYTLEVSSPGLDRPLRHADDFRRFAGRRAKVVMREAVDGQTFFKGRLDGVTGGAAAGGVANAGPAGPAVIDDQGEPGVRIVTDDGRQHRVPLSIISRANLEVEF